jgi:hypothetical protein
MFSKESVRAITRRHRDKHSCSALFSSLFFQLPLAGSGDSNREKQPAILAYFGSVSDVVVRFCWKDRVFCSFAMIEKPCGTKKGDALFRHRLE